MSETSASLLDRVRHKTDNVAWQRLVSIYTPLIHGWMRRDVRLNQSDADDIAQEVLTVVVRRIGEFRTAAFRFLSSLAEGNYPQFPANNSASPTE